LGAKDVPLGYLEFSRAFAGSHVRTRRPPRPGAGAGASASHGPRVVGYCTWPSPF